MTTNQLILSETELHEIEATEAEMHLCIEDEEGQRKGLDDKLKD